MYKNVGWILSKKKKRFWKQLRERYQTFSEEEKDKKRQYPCEQYRNISDEEKEKKCQYARERCKNFL